MSLVVWLPLTKDLRNQGLSNVTVTNNGATFNSAGKLGGCYSFSGSSQKIVNALSPTITSSVGSLSCWVKMNSLPGSSSFYNLMQLGNLGGYATCRLGLYMEYTNKINISIDGSSTGANVYTHSLVANQWYHICATYNGTIVKLYIDGKEVLSKTASKGSYTTAASYLYVGGTSSYYLNGYMNDARYYDHALSQMEVKELAKGLVLHYPLNRQGWGQENLVWNSNWNVHSTTPPESWVNWGSPPTREIVTIDGKNWLHVISNTTQFQGYSQNWTKRNGVGELTANTKMTVSFTAKLATAASIAPIGIHWCNSSGTIVTQNWTTTALTTSPKRYSFTYTTPANCVAFNIMVGDNTNTAHEVWVTDIKLEFGEIATPWCPNSSDALATTMGLNSTIEYDCSGFCNNGTRIGTFTWTSDTPKYTVSTKFNGAEVIVVPFTCGSISEAVTVACWGYESNWNVSTAERLLGAATNSSGWCIGDYGSENTLFAFYANGGYNAATGFKQLSTGWHHFVITFDGLNLIYYVDGQQFSKKTFSTKQVATGNYNINIGRHYGGGYNFKGNMSDVRIYATALSADDIKSLYQNSAYIDSSGNVYGAVHEEV